MTGTGRSIRLADLKNEFFDAFSAENIFAKDVTHTLCQNVGFFPKIFFNSSDFNTKIDVVDSGCAVALIPECSLADALKLSPDLRYYELSDVDYRRSVYVRCKKDALASDLTRDFWYFMLDYFGVKELSES